MDRYTCEACGFVFDEFHMNYRAAQNDKRILCERCRYWARQIKARDNTIQLLHDLTCSECGRGLQPDGDCYGCAWDRLARSVDAAIVKCRKKAEHAETDRERQDWLQCENWLTSGREQ